MVLNNGDSFHGHIFILNQIKFVHLKFELEYSQISERNCFVYGFFLPEHYVDQFAQFFTSMNLILAFISYLYIYSQLSEVSILMDVNKYVPIS